MYDYMIFTHTSLFYVHGIKNYEDGHLNNNSDLSDENGREKNVYFMLVVVEFDIE